MLAVIKGYFPWVCEKGSFLPTELEKSCLFLDDFEAGSVRVCFSLLNVSSNGLPFGRDYQGNPSNLLTIYPQIRNSQV